MKTKNIKNNIKEYFFANPTARLRVRQIEREVKVPLPSAIRYAKELEAEGVLQSSSISGITLFCADRTSKRFLVEKKTYNIESLHSSGLLAYLINEFLSPTIVLFGSYSRGEDIEESDIDLYIEAQEKKAIGLKKYEKILKRKIHLLFYKNIQSVENKELANNIVNGVTLNGFLEVFK